MLRRIGAYGIALQEGRLLLTVKKRGPYTGLLDLPGGKIEANESPEEALKREFLEEISMGYQHAILLEYATHTQSDFHHEGYLYRVEGCFHVAGNSAEEEFEWYLLETLNRDMLTPFAKRAFKGI